MTVRIRTDIKADNVTNLPDNTAGEISPADLRNQLADIIDSAVFPEDGGVGGGSTVDTGEPYRIIMLSDGTVRAIPIAAVVPATPTGVSLIARITSVSLSWSAVVGATSYRIKRNGVNYSSSSTTTFRDSNVTVGQTYEYRISSVDQYQQRSPDSTPVSAFIDIALNQAPANVVITMWPTPLPTDGYSFVRVNARELDVQSLAFALNVDVGSLSVTADPSTWILRI